MKSNDKARDLVHVTPADISSWQARMRAAVVQSVGAEEIRDIMEAIVAKAKKGDLQAARLVLSYAVGNPPRGDSDQVIDHGPGVSTDARPGTPAKLDVLARRFANGVPLHANGDGPEVDLS
jgi:ribosomal protein L17